MAVSSDLCKLAYEGKLEELKIRLSQHVDLQFIADSVLYIV